MDRVVSVYSRVAGGLLLVQHPLLLAIRVYWGWSLMWNGWGKLHHIDAIARWFGEDLGIPFPTVNAYMAGTTEFLGSLLLVIGLGSRPAALAVLFTMSVAFATSDVGVFAKAQTDFWCYDGTRLGDCFTLAAPFPYWFMGLLIAVFGPGALSADGGLRWWSGRSVTLPRPAV